MNENLLQMHGDEQAKILTEILNSCKGSNLKLKRKKMKLLEAQHKREEDHHHQREMEIKILKIQIKGNELQILN